MDLVRIDEVLSALEKTLKDTRIISKQSKKCISERFRSELRMLHIYNPEKQVDKIKSELSEILEGYEHKQKGVEVDCSAFTKKMLDAYRYAKASVDISEFEKAMKEAPKFVIPNPKTEYPIRKFKVVAKGNLGLVDHYVYADDVSEDENGCYFWIEDKKVGYFTNAVAYYEVRDNESDTN